MWRCRVPAWALLCAAVLLPVVAAAQVRTSIAYDAARAELRTVQNLRLQLDDLPGHELRLFDRRRTFRPADAPSIEGVRVVEIWEQGTADLVDQSGSESAYVTFVLADGNRLFGRYAAGTRATRWPDGSRHYDVVGTITLTAGTGAFARVRGLITVRAAIDPGADSNQIESRGEYWTAP